MNSVHVLLQSRLFRALAACLDLLVLNPRSYHHGACACPLYISKFPRKRTIQRSNLSYLLEHIIHAYYVLVSDCKQVAVNSY